LLLTLAVSLIYFRHLLAKHHPPTPLSTSSPRFRFDAVAPTATESTSPSPFASDELPPTPGLLHPINLHYSSLLTYF
jgi:hypothetical protein